MKKTLILMTASLISIATPLSVLAIYNGKILEKNEFNQVIGFSSRAGDCGGLMLSERVILTAAHCITETNEAMKLKSIHVSLNNRLNSKSVKIEKIIKHELFNMNKNVTFSLEEVQFDLALLFLQKDVATKIGAHITSLEEIVDPALLIAGSPVTVVGLGLDERESDKLKKMTTLNFEELNSSGAIFLNNKNQKGSVCKGDSGGGVFTKINDTNHPVGLLSGSTLSCGHKSQTSYSVPLYPNLDWIQKNLNP